MPFACVTASTTPSGIPVRAMVRAPPRRGGTAPCGGEARAPRRGRRTRRPRTAACRARPRQASLATLATVGLIAAISGGSEAAQARGVAHRAGAAVAHAVAAMA